MPIPVCSLILNERRELDPGEYHVVRFPFGGGESYDAEGMHQVAQPDGYEVGDWRADDRSGLIWPSADGWGILTAMIQWEAGSYGELRDQFVRDPLGLTDNPDDTTATDHRPPSKGMQCFTKTHSLFVHPGVPLALRVSHDAGGRCALVHAQFKLSIHT
ncbi:MULTISPECIES: hypothetical protein [Streptomyces]|uniref:Uncharacterized protein n=1 Tax=Streptomyces cacaoi TaxID=1898 RepID=A0A4Y3QW70_STRCI|nr:MULTISPECIES: hypothetical protein [Streptomyces]NNG83549.1 hypothetical protein [Streptomyces cacaoi]QHF92963.1 hypothetical protein DEH18_02530 [Streptomyces sp. NHF165]GEB49491.1 hypothetical protein SCA03_20420 [Streptomyces cacaoi]